MFSKALKFFKPINFANPVKRRMAYCAENRDKYWIDRVGTREWVGYGHNGTPSYMDRADFPFPAIRWKELSPEIQSINEKQRGDWRLLTMEEKKALYRANFCQTFSEFSASRGDWMAPIGHGLIICSMALWLWIFIRLCVYGDLPASFKPCCKRAQLRRQIELQMNPVRGLSSVWNYEKMDWKKKTIFTPENPFMKCRDDEEECK